LAEFVDLKGYNIPMPKKELPKTEPLRTKLAPIFDLIQSFIISLTVYVLIYHYIAQPQRVVSVSMQPNYFEGDRLIIEKVSYRFQNPQRGDVVVFRYPENPDILLIKRVIGLPGETITIKENQVFIDNKLLIEPYLAEMNTSFPGNFLQAEAPYEIPTGQYVMMGDNRSKSGDSRIWGTVAEDHILGQAIFRYWPPNQFGVINEAHAILAN
jgi:signal peptidase I